jgi:hypothetical protein
MSLAGMAGGLRYCNGSRHFVASLDGGYVGMRIHVVSQARRRRHDDRTRTENSLPTVPIPDYLISAFIQWKFVCPSSAVGPAISADDGFQFAGS